jgi:ribosome maturation factor RimP
MDVRHEVIEIAGPLAEEMGFELVDVEFVSAGRWTIRVYIDHLEGGTGPVSIDDCTKVSRRLDDALEMNQTVPHRFVLEVSSPGIERRLRTVEHFRRHLGERVFVQTHDLIDGRRRVEGELLAADAEAVTVATEDGGRWTTPVAAVQKAHLVVDPWAALRAAKQAPAAAVPRGTPRERGAKEKA